MPLTLPQVDKLIAFVDFVEMVARMTNERETEGGFGVEDMTDTLNNLIAKARTISGVNPNHQEVYCPDCGGDRKGYGCACQNQEPEPLNYCDCGDYCEWCKPEVCV